MNSYSTIQRITGVFITCNCLSSLAAASGHCISQVILRRATHRGGHLCQQPARGPLLGIRPGGAVQTSFKCRAYLCSPSPTSVLHIEKRVRGSPSNAFGTPPPSNRVGQGKDLANFCLKSWQKITFDRYVS